MFRESDSQEPFIVLPSAAIPAEPGWVRRQTRPVIALGEGGSPNADVIVADEDELALLARNIERRPLAAMALVQVLRAVEALPLEDAITVESLAYATLQGGAEHRAWLAARDEPPRLVGGGDGPPILLERSGDLVRAELNRPEQRNAISVEMRDALVELFELVLLDESIERLELSARGGCFSVGGELREFGLATDTAEAHRIRTVHSPGRLLARCAPRVHCRVHRACLGSGIELPAFAGRLTAAPRSFFQLPELELGLIPGAGGCVSISRRIGRQRTAWLVLSGRRISARRALEWGLVDGIGEEQDG